jgi:4-carboxymuconolactone decarboxylase
MAISEEAQRNHDALFPGHVSTLKVTDPELIEIFDNSVSDLIVKLALNPTMEIRRSLGVSNG